ncbi:MAG TPA: hypothetical protein VGS97_20310 [Actinocrinis sp.]|uniref:hypothetical protein n=1 Tax=Actinocrinis sp. TaxID=1920516 RepID=UPI002DDD8F7E|nr:hypothetical protein [Actinocrinis sp.]HEV2346454.1 hypothetical protein [Actinocrinis sp.]
MPTSGAAGDLFEQRDVNANVDTYVSATGELVEQYGLVLGTPQTYTANAVIPVSASNVEIGAIAGAISLTLPAASAVTAGHLLSISDANGSVSSSATVGLITPTGGGKIGNVSAATSSTSAASYAFLNSAYGALRLKSNGTNWNPW